jgi:hypothetical protein
MEQHTSKDYPMKSLCSNATHLPEVLLTDGRFNPDGYLPLSFIDPSAITFSRPISLLTSYPILHEKDL